MHPAATSAVRPRELPPGTRLGRYTLRRRIARGGMAELYLAQVHGVEGFEKLVAIKLVLPHVADDPTFVAMFLDEARLAARLDHPNIVQVLDLGVADGEHFMAMEYVHGRDVKQLLTAATDLGGLSLAGALTIVAEACAGLHHAHELADEHGRPLGVVHRDVSPSNFIVRYDGEVKVVDFGIAKAANHSSVTRTGALKGKAGYMSPEQCRGGTIDRRSDIFGLGILLFETTTCLRLFFGDNDFAVMNRIIDCDYEPPRALIPDYPERLEAIVTRALAKDPADRFPTAWAMRQAIEDFALAEGIRLSTAQLAMRMRELFGEVVTPTAITLPVTQDHEETSTTLPTFLRGRRRTTTVGLSVAGVALAVAGYLAGTANRAPARAPTPASTPDPAPGPDRDRTKAPDPAVTPETGPAGRTEASANANAAASDATPEAAPEVAPSPPTEPKSTAAEAAAPNPGRSKSRGRKRRAKRTSKPSLDPGSTPDDMMPRQ
ncbi:MAG: protein kinase [Myxococcota bacterium]